VDRMNRSERIRRGLAAVLLAGVLSVAAFASCNRQSPPEKPVIHATKAFDAIFGDLPSLPLPGPAYATIAYFPSSLEPERFRPVPIFSVEPGKEEALAVRTVIRGIEAGEGPANELWKEIVHPFPPGSELVSLSYDGGLATVTIGGNFRAEGLSAAQKEKAAKALALTVSQFGKAQKVEVAGGKGAGRFGADAKGAEVVDVGLPKVLGLMAIREEEGKLPEVLSVLFDRPVFVKDAAFFPPGGTAPVSGKVYSTAFGMTLEFHPEPKRSFDPGMEYRVRLSVRDGKGRQTSEDRNWRPKALTRR
jgi:hypothetical protein